MALFSLWNCRSGKIADGIRKIGRLFRSLEVWNNPCDERESKLIRTGKGWPGRAEGSRKAGHSKLWVVFTNFLSSSPGRGCRRQNRKAPVFGFFLVNVTKGQRGKGSGRRVVRVQRKFKPDQGKAKTEVKTEKKWLGEGLETLVFYFLISEGKVHNLSARTLKLVREGGRPLR